MPTISRPVQKLHEDRTDYHSTALGSTHLTQTWRLLKKTEVVCLPRSSWATNLGCFTTGWPSTPSETRLSGARPEGSASSAVSRGTSLSRAGRSNGWSPRRLGREGSVRLGQLRRDGWLLHHVEEAHLQHSQFRRLWPTADRPRYEFDLEIERGAINEFRLSDPNPNVWEGKGRAKPDWLSRFI